MEALFRNILEASIYGSVVILAVMLLRLVMNRAPRRLVCLLWLLAGLRLVMPFSIESGFSLQPRLDTPPTLSAPAESLIIPEDSPPATGTMPHAGGELTDQAVTEPDEKASTGTIQILEEEKPAGITLEGVVPWIWGLGLLVLCISSLVSYRRLKNQVREAWLAGDGCLECTGLDTAFVLGFFPPKIYLPANLPDEVRRYIVAHEKAHISRGDHWYKLVGYVVLSVHWFNPLVWAAYHMLCRDMEGACDERVIRDMDLRERKNYSNALLFCAGKQRAVSACPVAFGETSVKQRIVSVLSYKKPGFWISILGFAAAIFVTVCLLTTPGGDHLEAVLGIEEEINNGFIVWSETGITSLSSDEELEDARHVFRSTECKRVDLPRTQVAGYQIAQIGERDILFSENCECVWTTDGSCWQVETPETLEKWFRETLEVVYDRETSGEPFATLQEPENWLRGISSDAVSSAYIHAQGETIREGNTTSKSASFGYFAARRFDELTGILNSLPERGVMEQSTHPRITYGQLQSTLGTKGGVYVTIHDKVNGLVGVVLLDSKDTVKLLLTDELDKVERGVEYLDNLQCWILEDKELTAFLKELWADPPIITFFLTQEKEEPETSPWSLDRVRSAVKDFQQRDSYQANVWMHGGNGSALSQYWQSGDNWLRTAQDPQGKEQPAYLKMDECAFYRAPDRMGSGREPEWTGGFTVENEAEFLPWLRSFDWDSVDVQLGSAGLHAIETISLEDGTYETVTCILKSPFPVYKRMAQAGLLTIAISPEGELAAAELFATYEEDVLKNEITGESILAHSEDATRMTMQILSYDREQVEDAIAQEYDLVSQEQRDTALTAMYTTRCKAALDAVQAMEYYHMRVSYEFYQGTHQVNQHMADYWFDGENLLRTAENNAMTHMTLLHNGNIYQSRSADRAQWEPLKEENAELKDAASWVMYYVWNDSVIRFSDAVRSDDGMTVFLQVDQGADIEGIYAESYELLFTFDIDGNLKSVGLGTRNSNGTTMVQHIEWPASDYEDIQRMIHDQIYSIQFAG